MVPSLFRDGRVCKDTTDLIRKMLVLDPRARMTAEQVLESLRRLIQMWYVHLRHQQVLDSLLRLIPMWYARRRHGVIRRASEH